MKKETAVYGEYVINRKSDNSIEVFKKYDNVKGSLRDIADSVGFSYDNSWTTRQFGNKIVKEYGDGTMAIINDYVVRVLSSGSIETYRTYSNTKGALREVSSEAGFDYDEGWNTRSFGAKLIDFLNR